jgi:hypothetical protein
MWGDEQHFEGNILRNHQRQQIDADLKGEKSPLSRNFFDLEPCVQ